MILLFCHRTYICLNSEPGKVTRGEIDKLTADVRFVKTECASMKTKLFEHENHARKSNVEMTNIPEQSVESPRDTARIALEFLNEFIFKKVIFVVLQRFYYLQHLFKSGVIFFLSIIPDQPFDFFVSTVSTKLWILVFR